MIHTIHIDDSSSTGKNILRQLQNESSAVTFDNPELARRRLEGYMTSDEFKQAVKRGVKEKLK